MTRAPRPPAAEAPPPPLEWLREIAAEVARLDARRAEMLTYRDYVVGQARAAGETWDAIAAAAGASRQALVKRGGAS